MMSMFVLKTTQTATRKAMEDHQFEEITAALSVIICLLAWEFGATYLFYAYLVKATWDTRCAVRAAIKAANADIKKEREGKQ